MDPEAATIQQGAPSSRMPTAGADTCLHQLDGLTLLDDRSDGGVSDSDDVPSLCGGESSEDESDWPAAPADMPTTTHAADTSLEGTHTGELSWWPQPTLAQHAHIHTRACDLLPHHLTYTAPASTELYMVASLPASITRRVRCSRSM